MGQVDSKKELDKLLKATCEAFIMAITKLTVEPMLSFLTKVTAFRVAPALSAGNPLRQQVCLASFWVRKMKECCPLINVSFPAHC